jgi:hypothetical protein
MRSIVFRSCWLAVTGVAAVAGAIAACSGSPDPRGVLNASEPDATALGLESVSTYRAPHELAPGEDPIANVEATTLPALATAPVFSSSSSTLTVTVAPGELCMIGLDPASNVLVNGAPVIDSSSSPSVQATSGTVTTVVVSEPASDASNSALTTELILDYSNGIFATGLSGNNGSVTLNFTGNEPTLLGIKGTNTADTITFGANGVNVNADGYMDVVFGTGNGGVGTFVVSMGNGDDVWSAGGDSATGAAFANSAPANPAPGYGAGVVVYGGLGNDTFLEGTAVTPYETLYGGGQAGDTVDYSHRSNGVNVTLGVGGVANAISGDCAVSSDAGIPSGAGCVTDEWDDIKNDVFVVKGGSGNDFLTASPAALTGNLGGGGDAGAGEAGASDAGHSDAGASDAGHSDAGASDAGHSDAGASDAGHSDAGASDAGHSDAGGGPAIVLCFYGGAGNDTLTPYGGPYLMQGGPGSDKFVMGGESSPHGAGTLQGDGTLAADAGITSYGEVDFVDFSQRTANLNIDMTGATASGEVGEGVIISDDIENVHSGSGNDTITGNTLDNVINGGQGHDVFATGGGGTDTVDYSDRTNPVYVILDGLPHSGEGAFSQTPSQAAPFTNGTCAFTGGGSTEMDSVSSDFTNILGGSGADCLFGQPPGSTCLTITEALGQSGGNTCQNTLTGGPGEDMLFGYDQDDVLEGAGGVGADGAANWLDCGNGYANVGHDIGTGYKANCQF